MATRTTPEDEVPVEPAPVVPRTSRAPVLVWVGNSLASVEIIDAPPRNPRDGVCRCDACHASLAADWAERFPP